MSSETKNVELGLKEESTGTVDPNSHDGQASIKHGFLENRWFSWVFRNFLGSAEARGIVPVPEEERTEKSATSLFTLWFTANFSLLP